MSEYKLTKEQRQYIADVYERDVWPDSPDMVKFCTNEIMAVAWLPNGDFIPVDKQKIETRFCFGESGYDYDDAQRMVAHAYKSEDYFIRKNMKEFRGMVESLAEQYAFIGSCSWLYVIAERAYLGQPTASPLKQLTAIRFTEFLELTGGVYTKDIPGMKFTRYENTFRVPTDDELLVLLNTYKYAYDEHLKKVQAYLKRYGLSKVHAWSYWRDE